MNKFVIDSYAWIEYFNGGDVGKKVKEIVEDKKNFVITSSVSIAEIVSIFKRKNYDFETAYNLIISLSKIYEFNSEFAKEVGLLHAEIKLKNKHFGLADTFVLLTAKKLNAKVLTGDEDFRNIKEAVFLK